MAEGARKVWSFFYKQNAVKKNNEIHFKCHGKGGIIRKETFTYRQQSQKA